MQGSYDSGHEDFGTPPAAGSARRALGVAALVEQCGLLAADVHELESGREEESAVIAGLRLAETLARAELHRRIIVLYARNRAANHG